MASLFATTFVSRGNLCWPPRPRKGFLYAHPASSENSLILRRDASRGRPRDGVRAADRADRPRPVTARRSDAPRVGAWPTKKTQRWPLEEPSPARRTVPAGRRASHLDGL